MNKSPSLTALEQPEKRGFLVWKPSEKDHVIHFVILLLHSEKGPKQVRKGYTVFSGH